MAAMICWFLKPLCSMHAIKAIQMIEEDAHSYGLTEKVKAYLEAGAQQPAPSSE